MPPVRRPIQECDPKPWANLELLNYTLSDFPFFPSCSLGHRFFSMKNAYDKTLRRRAKEAAASIGFNLKEGVYTMMGGPNFETPAELRLLKLKGVDAVGTILIDLIFLEFLSDKFGAT